MTAKQASTKLIANTLLLLTVRKELTVQDEEGEDEVIDYDPNIHIHLSEAVQKDKNIQVGHYITQEVQSISFGRVGAQSARQMINQKVREAERRNVSNLFSQRIGELLPITVKRIDRGNAIVDLGRKY